MGLRSRGRMSRECSWWHFFFMTSVCEVRLEDGEGEGLDALAVGLREGGGGLVYGLGFVLP